MTGGGDCYRIFAYANTSPPRQREGRRRVMPLYEYRCKECGSVTEVLERPNARGRPACRQCGSRRMEKLLSAFGLRGTGSCSPSGSGFS